jgi:3-phosphoshikimate 1-carboxyvinyltransferase
VIPALADPLPILPFTKPVHGEISLPGSKSITNRALLLAALSDRRGVKLTGALFSEDTEIMAEALRKLGFNLTADSTRNEIVVDGLGGTIPAEQADLHVGLAGTAARFLTALCAAARSGVFRLDGVPQMRKRPMKPLLDALRALGADIRCPGQEGFFPLEIRARGLAGGTVEIDASESSQLLSALLMVAPLAQSAVRVKLRGAVRRSYVEMSARMMQAFEPSRHNLVSEAATGEFVIEARAKPYAPSGGYAIEPDASAASYYLALPLVTGGRLTLLGAQDPRSGFQLQGDTKFVDVVRQVGATVTAGPDGLAVDFERGSPRAAVQRNFNDISDTFLTLAAIAPLLQGTTTITGIAHTRKQETDRVAGMARELSRLGQIVKEHEDGDGLTITPQPLRSGVEIETYGDHRFAMSFGILGCHPLQDGQAWLKVKNPGCCAKTFPHFFQLLEELRKKSLGE